MISCYIMPIIVFLVIIYAFIKKIDVYDCFVSGVVDGMHLIIKIFPVILTMTFAVNIFIKSKALDYIFSFLFLDKIGFPSDLLAVMFLKPISSSSSLVLTNNIFMLYGPDSYFGRIASVVSGCTDTTIYILALYFGSVGVKNTRYALFNGLFADIVGIIFSVIIVNLLF